MVWSKNSLSQLIHTINIIGDNNITNNGIKQLTKALRNRNQPFGIHSLHLGNNKNNHIDHNRISSDDKRAVAELIACSPYLEELYLGND